MIQLDNVTKFYGERQIFSDVSFKIIGGEKVGIVGKNGAENLRRAGADSSGNLS